MPENVQKTETEEGRTVMTDEAEKDMTEEEMIDMTDTTGNFQLNSDVTEIEIPGIDMIETIEMIEMIELIEMIETTEGVIMTEIAMKEIVTETTEEEIAPDLTQIPNHPLKAAAVVIERKRNKEEDVLEAE